MSAPEHEEAGRPRRAPSAGFPLQTLAPRSADGSVLAFIETPRGCRNKYKFDEERQLFVLKRTLPLGHVFPWDFGFVPGTRAGDGDPLDVLVLMDEPAFTGCLVPVRLVGVLEVEQRHEESVERNDRLLAVATASLRHAPLSSAMDLPEELRDEIARFFVSAAKEHVTVEPLGFHGPARADALLGEAEQVFRRERSRVH